MASHSPNHTGHWHVVPLIASNVFNMSVEVEILLSVEKVLSKQSMLLMM